MTDYPLIASTFAPSRRDKESLIMITTYHGVGGLLLLRAAADGGRGGDHHEGEGPGHLAQGRADVVHRLAAQLQTVNLKDLVCNRDDMLGTS